MYSKSLLFVMFITATILTAPSARAQATYVGVWSAGNDPYALHQLNNWDDFVSKRDELTRKRQRLIDVEAVRIGNTTKYTGVWREGSDDYSLYQVTGWDNFVQAWQKFARKDLRLVDLEVFAAGTETVYLGVWRAGTDAYALHRLTSWDGFVAKWKELAAKNLRLVDIEAIQIGNNVEYYGVWRAGPEGHLFYAKTWDGFVDKWKDLAKQDQCLVDVEVVRIGFELHYIGIWHPGQTGYALYRSDSWEEFADKCKELADKNLRLIDLSIAERPGKPIDTDDQPKGKPLAKLFFNNKPLKTDPVSGLDFPSDMPAIHYPEFIGCNANDKKTVQEAWAVAHFSMWRAQQLINFIAASNNQEELWKRGFVEGDKEVNWSPRAWFGSFRDSRFRFQFIHEAINKVWNDRFLAKKYDFKVKCREGGSGGEHPCYLKDKDGEFKYSGNHIVLGTINFCPIFFDKNRSVNDRARVVVHEIFHWVSANGLYVSDTHTHSDKVNGLCKTKAEKMYGYQDALHLASSDGCLGNDTLHLEMAARNNDNYAYFVYRLGKSIRDGRLTSFP
jgi:hypothetical protein